jgi:hypothetical protein
MRWLTVAALIVGICFVALAGYLYPSPSVDASLAGHKLAVLPLRALPVGVESTRRVRIPNSKEWNLLIHEWGDPELIIGIESTRKAKQLNCFREANLGIGITDSAGHDVPVRQTQATPYGYVSECDSAGLAFTAAPGSELMLHVTARGLASSVAGELIVIPYWRYEKDRIVGTLIEPDLRNISIVAAVAGLGCLLISVWSYRRTIRKRGIA